MRQGVGELPHGVGGGWGRVGVRRPRVTQFQGEINNSGNPGPGSDDLLVFAGALSLRREAVPGLSRDLL